MTKIGQGEEGTLITFAVCFLPSLLNALISSSNQRTVIFKPIILWNFSLLLI